MIKEGRKEALSDEAAEKDDDDDDDDDDDGDSFHQVRHLRGTARHHGHYSCGCSICALERATRGALWGTSNPRAS